MMRESLDENCTVIPGKTVGLEFRNVPALLKDELGQPLLQDQLILQALYILKVHLIDNYHILKHSTR